MAHSDNIDNHHLTSLDIGSESSEGDTSSLVQSSSSEFDASPLNLNNNGRATSKLSPQHNNVLQPAHSPYAPTPIYATHQKPTNLPLLTACYMSALTTGATTYAFSFYSSALKSSLHLSQNELDTLSSAIFCAGVLSWIPGMIVDAWGARRALALGATSNTINLTLYWLIATERISLRDKDLLILVLSALGVLIFMGCALVTGSVFKVIVESCGSGSKGKAVGCAKGYVGLGSGVYVCLFQALFGTSGGGAGVGPAARALAFVERKGFVSLSSLLSDTPQNPELVTINFLLMAAVFSFLAATLPALLLLPKQTSSSINVYQNRRDGTRSIHFRVVYAGLILLGVWVVGVSLMELEQEEGPETDGNSGSDNTNGDANDGVDPTILNKTLLESNSTFSERISSTSYVRLLWNATRRLSSSLSPETHWGSVFFLILLWWGPALSLLVIPPRKESVDESITFSPNDDNESSFNYDDESDDENIEGRAINGSDEGNSNGEDEEVTFLQDDLPIGDGAATFSTKNGESLDPALERNFTLLQMLRTCPAWLMVWTTVILVGGGTVMTNNIGQMTEALGFDPATTSASLALFSAAQGASRVCTGIASELALKWKLPWFCGCFSSGSGGTGVPRPTFLVLASLISAASHFLLAVSTSEDSFALGVTLSGVAFGMVWPMMVLITGEVFGTRHVGANYMFFDGFSSAAGTLLLSKFVAQEVYDEHIVEIDGDSGASSTSDKCLGIGCFATSHVIVSLLSLTCVVSSIFLVRSTRNVYSQ